MSICIKYTILRFVKGHPRFLFWHCWNELKSVQILLASVQMQVQQTSWAFTRVRKTPSPQCWPESFCQSQKFLRHVHYWLKNFRKIWKMSGYYTTYPDNVESVWMIWKVSGWSKKCLDDLESIWTIYALYSENFCDKNLAIRKVFAFPDSGVYSPTPTPPPIPLPALQ